MTIHRSWARVMRAAAVVIGGVALVATVAASPASAATTASMSTFTGGCAGTFVGIQISGSTDHTYSIARSYKVELWGSDTFSDDFLTSYTWTPLSPTPVFGKTFYLSQACVAPSTLNEDDGTDEVYAKVFFYNNTTASGSSIESARTNELQFNF